MSIGPLAQWMPLTIGTINDLKSVFFPDNNTGYAVGGSGTILKTTDGGTYWTTQSSGTTNDLRSVYFIDANIGYTVGSDGTILKTINGGANWTSQSSGINMGLSSVFFTNDNTGYVVGGGGTILKTTNGGVGISELNYGENNINVFPNPVINIISIECPQSAIIEISNIQGQLIKTFLSNNRIKSFDVSELSSGLYILNVRTENSVVMKKIY